MNVVLIIGAIIVSYILGILTGIGYQSEKDTNDMIKNFSNTQRLRDENAFLKKQIEHLKAQLPEDHSYLI